MITSYVYQHTNIDTGEFYIGYRKYNVVINKLPIKDLRTYICSAPKIKDRIIQSRNRWKSVVLACFYNPLDAYIFEQELIKSNRDNPLILNRMYIDIEHGHKMFISWGEKSPEHKQKISEGLKRYVRTQTHRDNISKSLTGRTLSQECINKRATKQRGMKRSPEQCKRISEALKGHIISEDTKRKISESSKGKPSLKGKNNPNSKPILCSNGVVYCSQNEAASLLDIKQGDIANVLSGRQKSTKGYTFTYFEVSSPTPQ